MTAPELDATAALAALTERLPESLALHEGSFYVQDSRSFQPLPGRLGRWRKVALVNAERLHWCTDPLLVVSVLWTAMRHLGADFCLSSQGLTFMAQFKKKGSGGDPVTATADSEVLATARAALKYLDVRA